MHNVARALRKRYSEDQVYILIAKKNTGNFTYDGIETGGERVCSEVEAEIAAIEARGGKIKKLSVVGYSMGGLVARYAIGLLYANGTLDKVECLNFTGFASPAIGARLPQKGTFPKLFNGIGSNSLSASGKQLWGIDNFRDTGRPLLSILADTKSIFGLGLMRFRRRTLYANIINDRVAVFYTTGISKKDPFEDLDRVKCKFVKGFDDVILDPDEPVTMKADYKPPTETFSEKFMRRLKSLPFNVGFVVLFLPIGLTVFSIMSAIQAVHSPRRIKLHQTGLAGMDFSKYRVPLWVEKMKHAVDEAYDKTRQPKEVDYLSDDTLSPASSEGSFEQSFKLQRAEPLADFPKLELTDDQFEMIDSLNSMGWRKYPVWIHNHRHSHAAIVLRMDKESHKEGKQVLRHWSEAEFLHRRVCESCWDIVHIVTFLERLAFDERGAKRRHTQNRRA
jgi:hypothetical protein